MQNTSKVDFFIPETSKSKREKYIRDSLYSKKQAEKALNFHKQIPGYNPTPLVSLSNYAKQVGLKNVCVKDESYRFSLNAFKVLGGSYAVANLICKKLNIKLEDTDFKTLISAKTRKKIGDITLASTTDGNHGRGIAWAAEQLKQKCVINMPKGTVLSRVKNIESHGAKVTVTDMNYDDTVRYTDEQAKKYSWIIVQDTAWEGYTEIPTWIMQGYLTMAKEAVEQYKKLKTKPTHVFLQSGVGAMAGAVAAFIEDYYGEDCPKIISVEPSAADCVYRSAKKNGDKPVAVTGDLNSIMAGLCCGEVNPLSWQILKNLPSLYISCSDDHSANGMRILGNPLQGDQVVYSGESGAIGMGLLDYILNNKKAADIKKYLELDSNSSVLMFSTEGITDPVMYRKIVWYGAYSSL